MNHFEAEVYVIFTNLSNVHEDDEELVLYKLKITIETDSAKLCYQRHSRCVCDDVSNTRKTQLWGAVLSVFLPSLMTGPV